MVNLNCILATCHEWGQKAPPNSESCSILCPPFFEIWNLNKITMKSIVKFSAKHPTMTKVIKGAGIVAATIVTTKIAESTKSGEFSSKNGLSYDNENTDYTGYQADEVEQNRADLDELKADRKYVDDPIDVTEHIRNLPEGWHASEKKIASAAEHGYNLKPGQTWVENYTKNKEE